MFSVTVWVATKYIVVYQKNATYLCLWQTPEFREPAALKLLIQISCWSRNSAKWACYTDYLDEFWQQIICKVQQDLLLLSTWSNQLILLVAAYCAVSWELLVEENQSCSCYHCQHHCKWYESCCSQLREITHDRLIGMEDNKKT